MDENDIGDNGDDDDDAKSMMMMMMMMMDIQWHKSVGPLPSGGEVGCEGACFTITQLTRFSSLSLSSFSSSPSSSSLLLSLLSVSLVIVDGKQVRSWGLHVHCK